MADNHSSLATVVFDFCRKRLSWRRSTSTMYVNIPCRVLEPYRADYTIRRLEKDDAATFTTASITSPVESEIFSNNAAFMTSPATSSQPTMTSSELEAKPLPPLPLRSQNSFFNYASRTRESPPPDDIEAILQDYDAHQPNRFIAGLWHANNNNGNMAGMPPVHGIHMGNANGLRY
ncbi:MAG: hypothetical protein Q9202_000547 [Teloschistes flavicans]